MRDMTKVLLVALTLQCVSAATAQLLNPSFEEAGGSLNGWSTFNNDINNVATAGNSPRTGSSVAKIFGSFNGGPNYSGILQNQPAASGDTWTATAWVRHNNADSLQGTSNKLIMKVEFYSVPNGTYGTSDLLAEQGSVVLDASSPRNRWIEARIEAVAPPGTVEARVALVFEQLNDEGGAALVDDVSLSDDGSAGGWELVWADEFDGANLDPTKWNVTDIHVIKNNELQYYTPEDVYLDNGNLVLRSQARSYWGFDTAGNWREFNYTSGLVDTLGKFGFKYGKVEIRAQLPGTRGMWPAHWMLASAGGWPPEIDIMELIGTAPNTVHMSNHWGPLGPNGEPPWEIGRTESTAFYGPDFTAGFHTFGIEWFEDRVMYLIDGVVRFTAYTSPDQPFYLILNTAVGGDWPGSPDGSTVFPQYHIIDYVRVYAWSGAGAGLDTIDDTTSQGGTIDGATTEGEYIGEVAGINSATFDIIGENSLLKLDSTASGDLTIAVDSTNPFLNPFGITLYIDSVEGGFPSTVSFQDAADRPRRLASGLGTSGQRSRLFFAPGFLADYAITMQPGRSRLLQLGETSHTVINGFNLVDGVDLNGGTDHEYVVTGDIVRELRLPLADLGLMPGDSFRIFATFLDGNTAYRSNEFVGVAPGNDFDSGNPINSTVVLKTDDFLTFITAEPSNCSSVCDVSGGDADVDDDCDVDLSDLATVLGNFGTSSAAHGDGDTDFDGDIDLTDLANLLSQFGASCPG